LKEVPHYDCLIIGAGLAGLSMAYRLARSTDISHAILEKGDVGQSWIDMHDSLRLLSPMWVNQLPGHRFNVLRSFERVPKGDFVQHLQTYARKYALPLIPNTDVRTVTTTAQKFLLETASGSYTANAVVNATGYFCYPWTPALKTNDGSVRLIHSADYKSPAGLDAMGVRRGDRILIIGKRVSAGQLLEELDDAGYALGISVQSKIQTRPGGFRGYVKENLYYSREMLRIFQNPYIRENSLALMNGGKTDRIIRSGRLDIHAPVESISEGTVWFQDGSSKRYDLVIAATGFRPNFSHLRGVIDVNMPLLEQLDLGQHRDKAGLFFLGLDNLINFKSRYVRGIAADSLLVYRRVLAYLRSKK
jgi:uncharacterized NAD(P)/FAD-binding protein YdhS